MNTCIKYFLGVCLAIALSTAFIGFKSTATEIESTNNHTALKADAHSQKCTSCNGYGFYPCQMCDGTGTMECPVCDGKGFSMAGLTTIECPNCDGNGSYKCPNCYRGKMPCRQCNGTGETDIDY